MAASPAQVVKRDNEVKLTAKAYNNRILVEWLARVAKKAADLRPQDERLRCQYVCATWLAGKFCKFHSGRRWPDS